MSQRGYSYTAFIILMTLVMAIGAGVYYRSIVASRLVEISPTPQISPQPSVTAGSGTASTVVPSASARPTMSSSPQDRFESECPPGQVQYGVPLGCVSKDYAERCKKEPCPICLASNTTIATPKGGINVKDIRVGMEVWSVNRQGERIASRVKKIGSTIAPPLHQMVYLRLADGRNIQVSPRHPTAGSILVSQLHVGDAYDGSRVVSTSLIPYSDKKTYDLLPDSETGYYWANGVLLGSTLK